MYGQVAPGGYSNGGYPMQPVNTNYGQPQEFGTYAGQNQYAAGQGGYQPQQFSPEPFVDEFQNDPPLLEELGM